MLLPPRTNLWAGYPLRLGVESVHDKAHCTPLDHHLIGPFLASPCGDFLFEKALSKTEVTIETRLIQVISVWRSSLTAISEPAIGGAT